MLASALLLLSLATYHPSDPSFDTSTGATGPHAIRNWIGPSGAYLSDLLLQVFGVTAFGFPLWLGGLGWVWMRSQSNGSALLRWTGVILTLAFLPAVTGLLPWHLHWIHAMPIEGVTGRLMADLLARYLNVTGASILAGVLAAGGLYLGSNFSFRAAWEFAQERSIQLSAWHDRWRNWQADRADKRAEEEAIRAAERGPAHEDEGLEEEIRQPGIFARMFGFLRRRKRPDEDLLDPDEVPAYERMGSRVEEAEESVAARPGYHSRAGRRRSAHGDGCAQECERIQAAAQHAAPPGRGAAGDPRRHAARRGSQAGGEMRRVRVNGQVVQINPGPMVTTYEFKPDAEREVQPRGWPRRRSLPGDARREHLDRAHGGNQHIGIQVPNHDRETIHLRDVIESRPSPRPSRA
jgi:S-DNA-T family DNA segregation ATPase FtsK/SpoIIIE